MNRALLKQDSKDAMRFANPHPVLTTLAFLALTFAGSAILGTFGTILGISSENGEPGFLAGLVYFVVSIIFTLVVGVIQFGYYAYTLKVFKKWDTGIHELFAYFPYMFKVFGLSLFIGLFTYLWSMLCIIPGIIAALRYSQAFFILAENPDKGIRECVNESKALMKGRLWEYFVLNLSFILWHLLGLVTCGIAYLYVMPYMTVTQSGYYLSLKPYDGCTDPS